MFNFFGPSVPNIDADALKKAIDSDEDCIILDVRTSEEFYKGKIKNAKNIPVDSIAKRVEKEIPDKQAKIYVYCLSGSRSNYAVQTMLKLKYANVVTMQSGILAWRAKGYPLV